MAGNSDWRQDLNTQQACKENGWTWRPELKINVDGLSAYNGDHIKPGSALGRFLEAAKQKRLLPNPVLVIENVDRFSRQCISKAHKVFWDLVGYGVDVYICEPPMHCTGTALGRAKGRLGAPKGRRSRTGGLQSQAIRPDQSRL
jgi:DNA invertase Pin-like site-specific DNA recombinase